jgi:tetratricopeptide (TPR) repeat protein
LPHWYPQRVITGSIWRSSSGDGTPVRILVRLEENGRILKHWSSKEAPATDDAAMQRFVTTVAFEIMWSMGKGNGANSLENFQSYINGVEKFRRYKDMRGVEDFDDAERQFTAAIKHNPQYVKAHYYLGTLYGWRANYDDTDMQLEEYYEQKAREQYDMIQVNAAPEEQALGNFGLGLLVYRHYGREKRLSSGKHGARSPSDLKLREADQHFKEAMRLDPKLHFARTGHTLVYKEMSCIRRAIKEFERARREAEDKSSIAWIEKQITTLKDREQRAKQAMQKAPAGESRWSRLRAVFSWSSEQNGCV